MRIKGRSLSNHKPCNTKHVTQEMIIFQILCYMLHVKCYTKKLWKTNAQIAASRKINANAAKKAAIALIAAITADKRR